MLSKVERRAILKLDIFVLPVATMLYFLSFLDRSNIGNARVAGMQADLGISDHQYQIAITLTYVPYILAELPSNLVLKKLGPNRLLPSMVILWGIVTVLQGLLFNYSGLLACRWFLGLFEGGLLPGLVLYLSYFYPRRMLQFRLSIFFVSTSLAGAFSGLLAAAILNMDGVGGLPGWKYIFFLEGLFTFVFGVVSYFIFPKSPGTCMFLNSREKEALVNMLENDGVGTESNTGKEEEKFRWLDLWTTLISPHVLIMITAMFCGGTLLFGNSYFLPTVVSGLGYSGIRLQLMTVPPYAISTVVSLTFALISDKWGCRGIIMILASSFSLIGYAMFYGSTDSNVLYGSVIMQVTGNYLAAPSMSTWHSNNLAPHYRKAIGLAFGFIFTNSGGILSTWLYSDPPRFRTGTRVNLSLSILQGTAGLVNLIYLSQVNRRRAAISREEQGSKTEGEDATASATSSTAVLDDRDVRFRYTL